MQSVLQGTIWEVRNTDYVFRFEFTLIQTQFGKKQKLFLQGNQWSTCNILLKLKNLKPAHYSTSSDVEVRDNRKY